ncbi:hypothetical protein AB0P40_45070, partial [Streptomyces sp. NPDC079189]
MTVTPRSTQRALGAALSLVAALAVTGCVSNPPQPEPTQSTAPTPTSTNPVNPTPPSDTGATVAPVPEAESDSQAAAVDAATAALTAYAQPELPYQEWINGLYPY